MSGSGPSPSGLEGGGSSVGLVALEKSRLLHTQNTKVNKEGEDAGLSALLRDKFLDDSELDGGLDNKMLMQSIQLPKSSLDASVKERDNIDTKSKSKPAITVEEEVTSISLDARIDSLERSFRLLADQVGRLAAASHASGSVPLPSGPGSVPTTSSIASVLGGPPPVLPPSHHHVNPPHLRANRSIAIDRVEFEECRQAVGESFDEFYLRLRQIAAGADLCSSCHDSRFVTRIISGISDPETRRILLAINPPPDLQQTVNLCRSEETAGSQRRSVNMTPKSEKKKKEVEKKRKGVLVKKKKEDEERRKEELSQVSTNSFIQKRTTPAKSDDQASCNKLLTCILPFSPFQIEENMKSAPTIRTEFNTARKEYLNEIIESLQKSNPTIAYELNPCQYRGNRGRSCGATWPLRKYNDGEVIDEGESQAPINKKKDVTIVHGVPRKLRPKLLQFCDNRRPAYWGTWTKPRQIVGPRRPFGKETIFDYDVDSDDEWKEEVEPGDSLTDSEGEGEEKEPADDYEIDYEFVVPDNFMIEGEKGEDDRKKFERELKEKAQYKPSLIGCCWSSDRDHDPKLLKELELYKAVVLTDTIPIRLVSSELNSESEEPPMACDVTRSKNKASKWLFSDNDITTLIRVLHGNAHSKHTIAEEFQLHLERNIAGENKCGPSKAKILAKIAEIASYSKCTEAGAMNGKWCWLVQSDVLERYNLAKLPVINTWEFVTEAKKRGRKTDDSADEDTQPAKTPRVSLTKKFVQPASLSAKRVPSSQENELPSSG